VVNTEDLPDGFQMTELGPLPKEWRVVRLGEIARVKYGKAKPTNEHGNIPVIGSGGIYGWTTEAVVDFPTLIIGRKGAAGQVWLSESPSWPSDTTFYLEWKSYTTVDVQFIYGWFLLNPLSGEHAKTTIPSLQRPDLENFLIPLPPLAEQRAIAHVLRTVQRAKEATEGVIAALRELKKSLMQHLFTYGPVPVTERERVPLQETEIGPLPAHWRVVRLGEVAETTSGGTPSREVPEFFGGTIPWVKSGELNDTLVTRTEETITEDGLRNSNAKIFQKGTLLIAMYGATAGKVGILAIPATTNQAICAILPDTSLALQDFLFYALIRQRETLLSQRYGGAQPNLNQTIIRSFPIPLPPLDEQREIARMLQAVDARLAAEQARRAALEEVFKTLLHQLMTGKVRVKGFHLPELEWTP
jgi:type I restriction enzyme S subunit